MPPRVDGASCAGMFLLAALLYYEPPAAGDEQERDDLICKILTELISNSETGWVNPSAIKRAWRLLREYVPPRGLAKFIREHQQFQVAQLTPTRWVFSFSDNVSDPNVHAPVSDNDASPSDEGLEL